jgi:hydrogenase maturation protease
MSHPGLVVLGLGNTLLGDEGVGVHVIREMERRGVPEDVRLVEGGVGGYALLDFLGADQRVIIVDAADMGLKAGTVRRFGPEDVISLDKGSPHSLHQIGLPDVLELASALGRDPDVVIIGIQPENVTLRESLSPVVRRSLTRAIEMIHGEIREHQGVRSRK